MADSEAGVGPGDETERERADRLAHAALEALGGSAGRNDVIAWAEEHGGFPREDLEPVSRGRTRAGMRIGWAISRLGDQGLAEQVERGRWRLIGGGSARAAPASERTEGARNPSREYDEIILALDLYLRRGQPPTSDPEVVALSELLSRLPIHQDRPDADRFRNPNGVHMKLANFKSRDPSYDGVGLTGGGSRVGEVWGVFANRSEELAAAVERITATADGRAPAHPPEEDESEVVEGRILFREHRVRERNPALVRRKKAAVMRSHGRLACEVCGLDFAGKYGDLGAGFIECHHTVPLALGNVRQTTADDLALVSVSSRTEQFRKHAARCPSRGPRGVCLGRRRVALR